MKLNRKVELSIIKSIILLIDLRDQSFKSAI